jgi:Arylsulfotransferase (ASST)
MSKNDTEGGWADRVAKLAFIVSLSVLVFAYGYSAHRHHLFPFWFVESAVHGMSKMERTVTGKRSWLYIPSQSNQKVTRYDKSKAYDALSMTTSIGENNKMYVRIIDMSGDVVQQWTISWLEIWPDATHIPALFVPKEDPGTHIHGAVIMDNGDVVFNFEHLGLVRLDPCGAVVWRLPYRTHHSIHVDDTGDLWVSGQIDHTSADPAIENYQPPFIEPTLLKVSPDGQILVEKSVMSLLKENNLHSLLYMTISDELTIQTKGDTLHLNDIEVFPAHMPEGVFKHGDIMISLRNINTILVFDPVDWKVRYKSTGSFLRQHDPDFIDGNTFSIYDNNSINRAGIGRQSRILIESAQTGTSTAYFTGSKEKPFFSYVMGKHQWLPNGNLLITDTLAARAFELDRQGDIVWEYTNTLGDGYAGIVEEVSRLPPDRTAAFFSESRVACEVN